MYSKDRQCRISQAFRLGLGLDFRLGLDLDFRLDLDLCLWKGVDKGMGSTSSSPSCWYESSTMT